MKNVFKRVMAALLSLIMVLSLAACGAPADDKTTDAPKATDAPATNAPDDKETEAPTEAAEFDPKTITEGVTLTIAVEADDEVIDWNTNMTTLMLEEKFGVDLQFEAYAAGSFGDKLNVMINGGDELPDIIFGGGTKGLNSYQANWVETGAILELTEFYENPDYAKYINIAIEKEGTNFVDTMRDAEGRLWAMPKYYSTNNNDATAYRLWINTEYAEKSGFDELPTTTEGFFELCKAFVAAGDLNGNGLDDEIVFSGRSDNMGWFKFLMSPFVYAWDNNVLDVENGTLTFAYTTDGWKEGLKYVKQFFDEGILDTTILTQDKSAYNAIAQNPDCVVLADFYYQPQMKGGNNFETMKLRLKHDYVVALEGPSGRIETYYSDTLAYPGAMITVDCENPEAAFIVMDYMMSQTMGLYQRFGEEGVDWDYWENVDNSKFIDGSTKDLYLALDGKSEPQFVSYTNTTYWGTGTPQNKGYMLAGPGVQFGAAEGRTLKPGDTEESQVTSEWNLKYWRDCIGDCMKYIPEERIVTLPLTGEENNKVAEPQKVITKYWQEAAANFLTGVWDIDEYWDTYLAELEKMGISDLLAIYQTSYDRTK